MSFPQMACDWPQSHRFTRRQRGGDDLTLKATEHNTLTHFSIYTMMVGCHTAVEWIIFYQGGGLMKLLLLQISLGDAAGHKEPRGLGASQAESPPLLSRPHDTELMTLHPLFRVFPAREFITTFQSAASGNLLHGAACSPQHRVEPRRPGEFRSSELHLEQLAQQVALHLHFHRAPGRELSDFLRRVDSPKESPEREGLTVFYEQQVFTTPVAPLLLLRDHRFFSSPMRDTVTPWFPSAESPRGILIRRLNQLHRLLSGEAKEQRLLSEAPDV
ncbi:unnamed protein product [Pleuronectes platessa]|uniref:Uncharacterized protein n=1 Tax=Pleuronectes platessa TaxID=8262 RepID=A0A9N7W3J2_PLEPL|nr:unnamed protein product [Pleuronectes platessa]